MFFDVDQVIDFFVSTSVFAGLFSGVLAALLLFAAIYRKREIKVEHSTTSDPATLTTSKNFNSSRTFDIIVSASILIYLLPIFVTIAIFIRVPFGNPIFCRIALIGRDGHVFDAYKFCTMYLHPAEKDPRILPFIGNFLRRTGVAELPMLSS